MRSVAIRTRQGLALAAAKPRFILIRGEGSLVGDYLASHRSAPDWPCPD